MGPRLISELVDGQRGSATNGASVADARGFVNGPVDSLKQKIEFKPRSDGGFDRIEAVWNGCQW